MFLCRLAGAKSYQVTQPVALRRWIQHGETNPGTHSAEAEQPGNKATPKPWRLKHWKGKIGLNQRLNPINLQMGFKTWYCLGMALTIFLSFFSDFPQGIPFHPETGWLRIGRRYFPFCSVLVWILQIVNSQMFEDEHQILISFCFCQWSFPPLLNCCVSSLEIPNGPRVFPGTG